MLCGRFLLTTLFNVLIILFRVKPFTNVVPREVASCDVLLVPKSAIPYSVHQNGTIIAIKSASINNKISCVISDARICAVCVLVPVTALQNRPPTHCSFMEPTDDSHKSKSIAIYEW